LTFHVPLPDTERGGHLSSTGLQRKLIENMKIAIALALTAALGVGAGFGMAVWRFGSLPGESELPPLVPGPEPPELGGAGPGNPRVAVDAEKYDFGVMDLDAEMSHDFVIKNIGDGVLNLRKGQTSCRCTVSNLDTTGNLDTIDVLPGRSTKVTLTWEGNEVLGPYRQTATIHTNDTARPRLELVVSGRITAAARTVPRELVFSQVTAGEPATAEIPLYGYLEEALEVHGYELARPETAEYFDVAFEPLTPELLKEEDGAKSGFLVKVTVKPGLPQGPFRQTIKVQTNLEGPTPVEIPVKGTVTSDIMVAGPGWSDEHGLLDLAAVASRDGAERRLLLIVRGPHRREVHFEPAEISPDLLRVELGHTKEVNNGLVLQTPIWIRIPPGSRPANHLGGEQGDLGTILLKTGHPKAPLLRIRVRFVVEG